MGLAVAALAPGAVATALGLWGTDAQQQTYLPAFTGDDVPAAALTHRRADRALRPVRRWPRPPLRDGDGFVLDGVKSARRPRRRGRAVRRRRAMLDGTPALFLVESGAEGLEVEADPSMGVRAAALAAPAPHRRTRPARRRCSATPTASTYTECVRLSRLAWCALAVGTGQAVLDYVTDYVNERAGVRRADQPPPVGRVHGRRHRDRAAGDAAGDLEGRLPRRPRARTSPARSRWPASCAPSKGMRIGLDGVQLLGGHGFVKEHPVERWYRDLRAVGVMEGAVLV